MATKGTKDYDLFFLSFVFKGAFHEWFVVTVRLHHLPLMVFIVCQKQNIHFLVIKPEKKNL